MKPTLKTGFLIALAGTILVPFAVAQHECDVIPANTLQTAVDSSGVNHQIECWNAATAQVIFPLSPSAGVTSVFGRSGAVVAVKTDYSAVNDLKLGDGAGDLIEINNDIAETSSGGSELFIGNFIQLLLSGGSVAYNFLSSGATFGAPLTTTAGVINSSTYTDASSSHGTAGQTLSSTGTGTSWVSAIQTARITVPSADLLSTARITIVPAPGAGFFISPIYALFIFKAGSAAYTSSAGQFGGIGCGPAAGSTDWAEIDGAGFLDSTVEEVTTAFGASNTTFVPVGSNYTTTGPTGAMTESSIDNLPLGFQMSAALTGGGNGTLDIVVWYMVLAKA